MNNYSTLDNITNSLKLAWKYKILWVFVLFTTAGTVSGLNSNFNNFRRNIEKKEPNTIIPIQDKKFNRDNDVYDYKYNQKFDKTTNKVLGAATVKPTAEFMSIIDSWDSFTAKKFLWMPYAIFLILSVIASVIFSIIVSFIKLGWGRGAVITGTDMALLNKTLELNILAKAATESIGQLIKLTIVMTLLAFIPLVSIVLVPFLVVTFALHSESSALLSFLFTPIMVLIILALIALYFVSLYATRFIVIDRLKYNEALKKGWQLFRNNKSKTILLSFGNIIVRMAIFLAVMTVIGLLAVVLIAIMAAIKDVDIALKVLVASILIAPLALLSVAVFWALGGYLGTASEITYTTLYKFLTQDRSIQTTAQVDQNLQGAQTI